MSFSQHLDPNAVYEITDVLGTGSFGAVYRATHKKTKVQVAIKKIENGGEEAFREIDIMKEIQSKFVVEFHGNYLHQNSIWVSGF